MGQIPNSTRRLDEHISRALNKIRKPSTAEEITELLNRDLEPEERPFQTKEVANGESSALDRIHSEWDAFAERSQRLQESLPLWQRVRAKSDFAPARRSQPILKQRKPSYNRSLQASFHRKAGGRCYYSDQPNFAWT
jgi:hypothetical protein